ncbi:MAG TPA: helix-turn-helix domain-containing protein [Planctomycetaceae bacterium]
MIQRNRTPRNKGETAMAEPKVEAKTENKFSSVTEMIGAISSDDHVADSVRKRIAQRQVVKALFAMRAAKGIPQSSVADALGCTQSRFSKIENGLDGDLSISELEAYARALDQDVCLVFRDRNSTAVDRVKMHAFQIKKELERMAEVAHKDESIAEAVAGFFGEAFFNLVKLVQRASNKLPKRSNDEPYIHIGVAELLCDEHHLDAPKPRELSRRVPKPVASVHANA